MIWNDDKINRLMSMGVIHGIEAGAGEAVGGGGFGGEVGGPDTGGVVVANSKRSSAASAGSPASITVPWQDTFSTTDFFEVFVENNDNTTNILVSSAISRAN
jgi:hypothetical protein